MERIADLTFACNDELRAVCPPAGRVAVRVLEEALRLAEAAEAMLADDPAASCERERGLIAQALTVARAAIDSILRLEDRQARLAGRVLASQIAFRLSGALWRVRRAAADDRAWRAIDAQLAELVKVLLNEEED